jgi:hypothetical protein
MTVSRPDALARERSPYVAAAIAAQLQRREDQLVRACEIASRDANVLAIARKWDALAREIAKPWTDAPAR